MQETFLFSAFFFFHFNQIYIPLQENECFQEALRSTQRKLLKVNRDKSFLLDRLLQYEKVDASFSESDETESSDEEVVRLDNSKRYNSIHIYIYVYIITIIHIYICI